LPNPHKSAPRKGQWLAGGFLLTFSSAFGQTFFIALFAQDLKSEFGLSDGAFGTLYMLATLASAGVLMWIGQVADRRFLRPVGGLTLAGLALAAAAMAGVAAAWMLLPILFALRLLGQGLPGHIAMTAMARWFVGERGRAIALAAMGFPASQAIIPIIAVTLAGSVGWRMTWALSAAALLAVSVPLILILFRTEPEAADEGTKAGAEAPAAPAPRDWTRSQVLRDPIFHAVMPGVLAPPFVATGIFFHQITIVQSKGWDLVWFVGWYAAHALTTVAAGLATGWVIDRFTSARVLPTFLVPLVAGVAVLGLWDSAYAVPVFMVLSGLSIGSANTVQGALWAELYGTRHLGAIRSLASAGMVFASALAPGLMGYLFDAGLTAAQQLLMLAAYTLLASGLLAAVTPRLGARAG